MVPAIAVLASLSLVSLAPKEHTEIVAGQEGSLGDSGASSVAQPGQNPVPGATQGTSGRARSDLRCVAGRNGGATDVGVTGSSIKLGATVVDSGIGAAFLSDVRYGMQAVLNEVNATGGICGRALDLVLKDDGWDAQVGSLFIRNLVEAEKVFALAVVPSSEGLRAASGYIRAQGVPVVGTDGMLISQYLNPMVWPVASSTVTALHIMAKDAHQRGRKRFAMVYDSNFRFGVEGAFAYNGAVKRLTGANIPGFSNPLSDPRCSERFCGIKAGQPSYQTEIEVIRSSCNIEPKCDYIAYLMEPETAQTWMRGGGMQAGYNGSTLVEIGGPQPLFNRSFGVNCAQKCHQMRVWTGFIPPVAPFTSAPAVAAYVSALRRTNAKADAANSFVEGGYIGMKLLVDALRKVGPDLTRARLIASLNDITYDGGLAKPLTFRKGGRFANRCMMPFSFQSKPSFAGWRQESDWVCDPWPGQDIPPSES